MAQPKSSVTVQGAPSELDYAQPIAIPSVDEMRYAMSLENTAPSAPELSLYDTARQMFSSPANKMPTYDQVINTMKGFGQAGESLGRGFVAGIPGMFGDINQLGQEYITPHLPATLQYGLQNMPSAPTTQDYLNQIPRYSNQFGDSTANNFMEGLGSALSPDAFSAAKPAAKFLGNAAGERIMRGESMIPGFPAGAVNPQIMSAVKNKGGNFATNSLNKLDELKTFFPSAGSSSFDSILDNANSAKIASHVAEMERIGYAPDQIERFKANAKLNDWVDKKLKGYVRNEMGTPTDPVRELHEQGISHINDIADQPITDPTYWIKDERKLNGMPEMGFAKSPAAKDWENRTDQALSTLKASYINPRSSALYTDEIGKLTAKDPEAKVHAIGVLSDQLKFNHLVDELRNATVPQSDLPAHLRLKPETLEKMTVPHAVKHVAKINKYRTEQMAHAAKEGLKDFPVVHEGDKGFKIHELKLPDSSLELPEGHKVIDSGDGLYGIGDSNGKEIEYSPYAQSPEGVIYKYNTSLNRAKLDRALKNEGEQMGHCVGGYTDSVANGKSRIFSLRDEKGGAHATIEMHPERTTAYEPKYIPDDVKAKIDKYAHDETIKAGYKEGTDSYKDHYRGVKIQEGSKYLKENPTEHIYVDQIKGKGNGAVSEKYRNYIQDFLNKESSKIRKASDLENIGVFDMEHPPALIRYLDKQYGDEGVKLYNEAVDRNPGMGKRFMTEQEVKNLIEHKPAIPEQKMLQGFYRGYAGEPTTEGTMFASPQKAVADYYAQKRAAQTGLTPHAEMVLADPFAGTKYGHATAGTGANPNLITQARKLEPSHIIERTQLYKKGGTVKMSEGGEPKLSGYEKFKIDNAEKIRQGQEDIANRNKYDPYKGSDKPIETPKANRGVSGGAGFNPGTMNPFNPDSPLNRKNGGKISADDMKYELLRNK